MNVEKRYISAKILFEAVSEQLACGRQAVFTVTGMSMWPFIRHGRDSVIVEAVKTEDLRKGDIVLLRASEEQFLLHRITRQSDGYFETTGDGNLFRDGKFPYSCIIARVRKVIRKGKTIDCDSFWWKMFSGIWMLLFPVRKYLFRAWFLKSTFI